MMRIRPTVSRKLEICILDSISILDTPIVCKTMKNTAAGTIMYAILKIHNRKESYMFIPKFIDGNMADSFNPIFTIDNRYPGAIRINAKNAIAPKIKAYLLSNISPIGTSANKKNRKKSIGNFLIFLKGYLNEFDIIFPMFIKSPITSPQPISGFQQIDITSKANND